MNFTDEQIEILILSAWFHDTGFINGFEDHEGKSIQIAAEFLKENHYPSEKTALILKTIKATDIAIKPVDILEMIIRDADIVYIGMERFYEKSFLLKHERESVGEKKYSVDEWINSNLDFLARTEFYTSYAKANYEEGRQKNISHLKSLLK